MKLIIQIPCFNEERTLSSTIQDLPKHVDGFDTVEYLVNRDSAASFCWIMRSDAYYGLPSWHRWTELFDLCNFVVVNRPIKEELIVDPRNEFLKRKMVTIFHLDITTKTLLF